MKHGLNGIFESLARLEPTRITLLLSALLLVLYGSDNRVASILLRVFGLAAIFLIDNRRWSRGIWWSIAVTLIVSHVGRAYTVDNHKVLLAYWALAIALSLDARRRDLVAVNARILVACVFVAATLWKCFSGAFVDGSFMTYTMLLDSRFAGFTTWTTGTSAAELFQNMMQIRKVLLGDVAAAELLGVKGVHGVGLALTWYTMFIEGGVALAFLAPRGSALWRCRNVLLIAFIVTVYSVAAVIGFAWTLAIMGYAQCHESERRSRAGYLLCFVFSQFYLLPWRLILS